MSRLDKYGEFISGIRMSLSYSWISLIIIVLVILLLSLDQGQTIFIDLLDHNPVNLIAFYILSYGLAKVVSHYPEYIDIWHTRKKEPSRYFWKMDYNKLPRWSIGPLIWLKDTLGLGVITYGITKGVKKQWSDRYRINNYVRRGLGLVIFLSVIYVLVGTMRVNHLLSPSWCRIALWGIPFLFFGIHVFAQMNYSNWKLIHLRVVFWSSYVLIIATIFMSIHLGWSRETIVLFFLSWCMSMLRFILFRAAQKGHFESQNWIDYLYRWRGHTMYVIRLSWYGFASYLVVFYAHLFPKSVNALIIIIAYLNIMYGLIILPIKGYLYHHYQHKQGLKPKRFYLYLIPLLPVIVVLLWAFGTRDNSLHLLPTTTFSNEYIEVTPKEFIEQTCSTFNDDKPVYFVASYGGGLKANAWNLLVLDELNRLGVLNRTIVLSGVSGGSLGQHLYSALQLNHKDADTIRNTIREISTSNFLSVDAAHFLGADYIREFIPDKILPDHPDRAMRSMNLYNELLHSNNKDAIQVAYSEYWTRLYRNKVTSGQFYPMLLSSSTSTHHERGIVCSLDFRESFERVFPASTDILFSSDSENRESLPYLYAASCTNRFPVFSPAAKVAEKGHFVDGGYFENSGLLSLMNTYDWITKQDSGIDDERSYIIQIVNDKPAYIRFMLKKWMNEVQTTRSRVVEPVTELTAVLGTITSIDQMPRYVNEYVENRFGKKLIEIHLPYVFTISDVEAIYAGEVDSDLIKNKISVHNEQLKQSLTENNSYYDIAEPPLARLLGDQAFNYMKILAPEIVEKALK